MLSDLLFVVIFFLFLFFGISRPYIALSAVIWVDIFKPQDISSSFLSGKPLSFVAASFFFLSLFLGFSKINKPQKKAAIVMVLFFMIWVTLSTVFAEFQVTAWNKYNWAVKVLIFAVFIPLVLDTRLKVEVFLSIMVTSIGYFLIVAGIKGLLSGGGYGIALVDSASGNSGITESSTLSMVAVFAIPLIVYLYKFSFLVDRYPIFRYYYMGLIFAALFTVIGTQARTGLVCLVILILITLYLSKDRLKHSIYIVMFSMIIFPFIPNAWMERMETMKDTSQEKSALGRVVVWRWTVDYANSRPFFGGGFRSYHANAGILQSYQKDGEISLGERSTGKAFHSIYFEVLGEAGYVGLLIFLSFIYMTWKNNIYFIKTRSPDNWRAFLAKMLNISLIIYCVGGAFISVAFEPWLYYLLMLSASNHNINHES
jgi:probable O-glycosylation ligase (exosortase A-associated)